MKTRIQTHIPDVAAPAPPRLAIDDNGRLYAYRDEKPIHVAVRPCFPWSAARRFLSLRDMDFNEVALIEDPDELNDEARHALDAALAEARFTFSIRAIRAIERDFELRIWRVDTEEGLRSFAMQWDDFPEKMSDGSLVLKDLGGDLYRIPEPDSLDRNSARLLWAFRG